MPLSFLVKRERVEKGSQGSEKEGLRCFSGR